MKKFLLTQETFAAEAAEINKILRGDFKTPLHLYDYNIRTPIVSMPLNQKQMLPLLALLSAFPALSTDMYLPALPSLAQTWRQPMAVINLTLFCFFLTYGVFLLVYGPLSDRFGRRPALMAGISVFIAGSLMCAFAWNAASLILFRGVQAAGAASASALSMAMSKDLFDGRQRVRVLAHIAVIMTIAPMIGPIIGGWIMTYLTWPYVFWVQALLGITALGGVLLAPETLREPVGISPGIILKNYFQILTNRRFMAFTLMMAGGIFPFFAFIGGASEIYILFFGLSKQHFTYFFSLNAIAMMIGSAVCGRVLPRVAPGRLITVGYSGVMAGGAAVYFYGALSPWHLALSMSLISLALGLSRPPSNNIVLEQVQRNIGTASSVLIFANMMCGAAAMEIIALDWSNKIRFLGVSGIISGGAMLLMWLALRRVSGST